MYWALQRTYKRCVEYREGYEVQERGLVVTDENEGEEMGTALYTKRSPDGWFARVKGEYVGNMGMQKLGVD
jgi:hypothetical protein